MPAWGSKRHANPRRSRKDRQFDREARELWHLMCDVRRCYQLKAGGTSCHARGSTKRNQEPWTADVIQCWIRLRDLSPAICVVKFLPAEDHWIRIHCTWWGDCGGADSEYALPFVDRPFWWDVGSMHDSWMHLVQTLMCESKASKALFWSTAKCADYQISGLQYPQLLHTWPHLK